MTECIKEYLAGWEAKVVQHEYDHKAERSKLEPHLKKIEKRIYG